MSTIDLERLIVRQTYFVPVQRPNLATTILKELRSSDPDMAGVHSWLLVEEHKLSFLFEYDLKYTFIYTATFGMNKNTKEFKRTVKEKAKEYDALGANGFYKELKLLSSHIPADIYVSIKRIEKNGCLCKVECLPTLYRQFRYLEKKEISDFEIQDAYLECKRFLETVFEGGLSATLVVEERKELLKPSTQLLINDETSRQLLKKIEKMLDQATGEVLFCGWVGTILLPKLKEIKEKGVDIRIITHQSSELKGKPGKQDVERAFSELTSMIGKDHISRRPECHCRVLVVDNKALIGSMDLNSISLTGTHREIAIYTEDAEMVRTLRRYFQDIFS